MNICEEEKSFIVEIIKSFKKEAYDKYADFLNGKDDAKAAYLKSLSSCLGEEHTFEENDELCEEWRRLVGCRLINNIHEYEIQSALDDLFPLVRPLISMESESTSDDEIPVGASKFGGDPDVPSDFEWPECQYGPINFQLQISFKDIADSVTTAYHSLPKAGHLLLFAYDDPDNGIQPGVIDKIDDKYGEIPGLTKVICIPEGEELQRMATPEQIKEIQTKPCSLIFSEYLDFPWTEDTENENLTDDEVSDSLDDLRGELTKGVENSIMGYQIHGRTCNTSPGPEWTNFMTLGSDENSWWSWCDGEHLDIYVHLNSLKDHSFKEIFGYAS